MPQRTSILWQRKEVEGLVGIEASGVSLSANYYKRYYPLPFYSLWQPVYGFFLFSLHGEAEQLEEDVQEPLISVVFVLRFQSFLGLWNPP